MVDGNGRPLWEPSVQVGQPDRILGFPVLTDPNLTAVGTAAGTPIAFGDWSTFYIRDVGSVRLERSDDYAFANDLVTWRCIFRTDSDLIDATGSLKRVMAPTT
jgi:HK97 family phage major capsid protein